MQTLAKHFAALRAEAEYSYADVAQRCRTGKKTFSRHVVWKVENGKPIKADTLAVILRRGLGIPENDEAYIEAFALWSAEQSKSMSAPTMRHAIEGIRLRGDAKTKAFAAAALELLVRVPDDDRSAVLEALQAVPALKLWLASRK